MTLDEAIDHARSKAECGGECAAEHAQLAEWLEELRELRGERTCRVKASYDTSDVDSRGSNAEWYFAFTCGCELYWDEPEPPSYCPNCGAKVVGE